MALPTHLSPYREHLGVGWSGEKRKEQIFTEHPCYATIRAREFPYALPFNAQEGDCPR